MYLERKIDKTLVSWLRRPNHSPALIYGVRQCGKTESIFHFAKENFHHVVYINFWFNPSFKKAWEGDFDVDSILRRLSFESPNFKFVENETIIVLDEIQDCPRARLSLKNFKEDKRYEVIATGSYIGLNIDGKGTYGTPKPNGSEDVFRMFPLDFEEFAWSMGFSKNTLQYLEECFENKKCVDSMVHEKMKALFSSYMAIGGYPEVIMTFLQENSYSLCLKKLQSLVFDIKGDPSKRIGEKNGPLYTPYEVARIQSAFDLVPVFLSTGNERYVTSRISGGSGSQKYDAVSYLCNASVVTKAYNVTNLSLPLAIGKIENAFKLFYGDIGLLMAVLGIETMKGVISGNLGMNKGYLYESAIADILYKNEVPLYYFRKNSGLEIDLVIEYEGESALIEAKAKSGNTKSSKTVLSNPDHYGKARLIKIGDYNIGFENGILTIPHYLTHLIARTNDF